MNERIKALRHVLGLTQQEFAEAIGVKRNTVATYEMGRSVPSDSGLSLICKTFNVNETWLRTGEGDMFRPRTRNEELFEFFNGALEKDPSDIRIRLLNVMARLTDDQWELLADMARKLAEEQQKADPS